MRARSPVLRAAILLAAAFFFVAWPLILLPSGGTSEALDQQRHHEPFIRAMAETWPFVPLEAYASATTPGYHLALSLVARVVDDAPRTLRLFASLFTLGLLIVVARPAVRAVGVTDGVLLTLPLAFSAYVVSSGAWLVTDNAGWLFALLAVSAAVFAGDERWGPLRSALSAVGAVFVRQVHFWTVGPALLLLLGGSPLRAWLPAPLRSLDPGGRGLPTLLTVLALSIAVGIVLGFAWWWGGLVPPRYQGQHASGINPAAAVITFALAGVFGLFFLPWFIDDRARRERGAIFGCAMIGVGVAGALWILIPSSYDVQAGRWGALWTLARHLPAPMDRSLLMLPLMIAGGAVLAIGVRAAWNGAGPRPAMVLTLSMGGWLVAQMANAQAWQRYCEPPVLVMLCWLAVLAVGAPGTGASQSRSVLPSLSRFRRTGLAAAALFQLLITLLTVHRVALAAQPV